MARTLRYGIRGDDVSSLQQGLNQLPSFLPRLNADGIYGSKTTTRVQEFQRSYNLASDGIVGPITWEMFLQILKQIGGTPPIPPTLNPFEWQKV